MVFWFQDKTRILNELRKASTTLEEDGLSILENRNYNFCRDTDGGHLTTL